MIEEYFDKSELNPQLRWLNEPEAWAVDTAARRLVVWPGAETDFSIRARPNGGVSSTGGIETRQAGLDLVKKYIDGRGGTADKPEQRWREFAQLISSPRLPSGLVLLDAL